ncbi:MAG: hypothetical protein HY986_16915 [Candidatus Melainabacteria bacterium]|nr:hypothetical protein [Candidatus Melainabacteria bacterium]
MTKSFKKSPFTGNTTAVSEKADKRFFNRAYRRRVKIALVSIASDPDYALDAAPLPLADEIDTAYSFDKDGKQYLQLGVFVEQIRDGSFDEIPASVLDKYLRAVDFDAGKLSEDQILELATERLRDHLRK